MAIVKRALGEICDEAGGIIRTGPFGSQLHESDYQEDGLPVIMPKDIVDGKVSSASIAFIGADDEARLSQHKLHKGDIVYGRRGDIGRRALIGEREDGWLCGTGCIRISPGKTVIDPVFLYYYLGDSQVIGWVANQAIGATLPNLNASIIRSIPISYPPLPIQRKIAAILSAYDDLIEVNTRRIALLEEMARGLYREWFVRFRFPGHEGVRMMESAVGLVPEGWEVKQIGEVIDTLGGGTPSTKEPELWEHGDVIWFTPSDLTAADAMFIEDSGKKISRLGLQKSSARLFPPYSVMMTSRATIGVTAINTKEACTNQGFITCVPNERLSAYHIYFWIKQHKDAIVSVASGATYKEISRSEFREFKLPVPDLETSRAFATLLTPIGRQIETFLKKNVILRRTRDLLLPRLVAGEVDVSELEIGEGRAT